jgi:hypothetical protein
MKRRKIVFFDEIIIFCSSASPRLEQRLEAHLRASLLIGIPTHGLIYAGMFILGLSSSDCLRCCAPRLCKLPSTEVGLGEELGAWLGLSTAGNREELLVDLGLKVIDHGKRVITGAIPATNAPRQTLFSFP